MTEVDERLDALLDYRMRGSAGNPRNECHTARIVLHGRVEQTSMRELCAWLFSDTCVA